MKQLHPFLIVGVLIVLCNPIITRDGKTVIVRVRVSSTHGAPPGRRAFSNRIVRFDETLHWLRQEGVRRIQIVDDKETLPMHITSKGSARVVLRKSMRKESARVIPTSGGFAKDGE